LKVTGKFVDEFSSDYGSDINCTSIAFKLKLQLKKLIVRKMPKALIANLIAICDFCLKIDISLSLQECAQWICHMCLSACLSACNISKPLNGLSWAFYWWILL